MGPAVSTGVQRTRVQTEGHICSNEEGAMRNEQRLAETLCHACHADAAVQGRPIDS